MQSTLEGIYAWNGSGKSRPARWHTYHAVSDFIVPAVCTLHTASNDMIT